MQAKPKQSYFHEGIVCVLVFFLKRKRGIHMTTKYEERVTSIVKAVGGAENIARLYHCATRLRFDLVDKEKADMQALEKIEGTFGVVQSVGGLQIIIGNDVSKVYAKIVKMYDLEQNEQKVIVNEETKGNVFSKLMNVLAAIMGPVIPLIMCSGLISAVLVICGKCGLRADSSTYTIMSMVGNAALYSLPVFVAYSSAKKFGCNILISVFLGTILISPTLISLTEVGSYVSLFALPVKTVNYTSTLIPIILTIWAFSYVEKGVEVIVPDSIKFVFRPFLSIVIMLPIMLCITGPLGSYCGDALCNFMNFVNTTVPWASVLVVGCLAPLLVLTGMHLALLPIIMGMFATSGYDNMLFVAFIGMNFSQFGVAMACFFKTKKTSLKTLASSCALTTFLAGVTEPTLYGICVRMKKPLIATWIACVANAIFCAIFSVKVYSFGAPSFFTMPIFLSPDGTMTNFYFAIGAVILTIVVSFVATLVLGFDDSCYED